jgi:hypothetical protein
MPNITLNAGESIMSLDWDDDGSGDYLVSIEAEAEGFKGHADGHVTGSDLRAFIASLEKLERSRKGKARLISALPGEFEVTVEAVDSVGHMGVAGVLRYTVPGDERPSQILQFAFDFEPSQLIKAVSDAHAV